MPSAEKPGVQLAYFLPVLELLIFWTLVFVSIPDLRREIHVSLHPPDASAASEKERLLASEGKSQDWQIGVPQVAWLANVPGMWSELATSTGSWPDSWFPAGFPELFAWRAVLWPLAAMPFWWSAGKGLDWFLYRSRSRCRVGWLAVALAVLNVIYSALLVALGVSDDNPSLRSPALDDALAVAGGLWLVLGAITCCAAFLQWRLSRAQRRTERPAAAAPA